MSDLTPVRIYDPRCNLTEQTKYGVATSGVNLIQQVFPSSSSSSSQVSFLPVVPNSEAIVSRSCLVKFYYRVDITGTTSFPSMGDCVGMLLAPRACPNASIINTLSSTINNTSISINLANNISCLQKYNNTPESQLHSGSIFPSMNDFFQNYNDGYATPLDPLGKIGSSGYQQPRGGYADLTIIGANANSLSITFSSTEPLYLSPWTQSDDDMNEPGFIGVNNLSFNLVLGDLSRCLSVNLDTTAPFITINTINVTFPQAPEIIMTFIQPSGTQPIPKSMKYNYSTISEFTNDIGVINPGASFTSTSQNIQLTSIPKRVYIYARRSNSDQDYSTSDVFARMDKISIDYDLQSGVLAGSNSQQLYRMAAYNGYSGSYSQWYRYTGSPLCLTFAQDIMINNPLQTVGSSNVKKNFQCTVNFTNISNKPVRYTLYVVVVSDGLFTLGNGSSVTQVGVLTESDVLNAENKNNDSERPKNFYGGSLLKKVYKVANAVGHNIEKYGPQALKYGQKVLEYTPRSLLALQRAEMGNLPGAYTALSTGKGLIGGMVGGKRSLGGKLLTKKDLEHRRSMLGSGTHHQNNDDDENEFLNI